MQPPRSFAPAGAQRKGNPAGCWTQRVPAVALSSKCRSSQGQENIPQVLGLRLSQLHALGWRLVCSQRCRHGGKNPPQCAHVLQLLVKKKSKAKREARGRWRAHLGSCCLKSPGAGYKQQPQSARHGLCTSSREGAQVTKGQNFVPSLLNR